MKKLSSFNFVILILASWRLSSMLANDFEQGPFNVLQKIRNEAKKLESENEFWKKFGLSKGLECEWCNSVWVGFFFTLGHEIFGESFLKLVTPLAISAGVVYSKYFVLHLREIEKKGGD